MPLAGEGVSGLGLGIATPTLTLFLHWVYGIVPGTTYRAMKPGQVTGARTGYATLSVCQNPDFEVLEPLNRPGRSRGDCAHGSVGGVTGSPAKERTMSGD
jgi:hypothetical protein